MKIPQQIIDLKDYDKLYFNDGDSPISDLNYDLLKEEAKSKYPDHSYFTTIGASIKTKNVKVKLPYVLGSLNKIKDEKSLNKWYEPNSFYIGSEKLDGISIYVKYIDDKLIQATTRGDGTVGQDITQKAKLFCPIPKNNVGILEVRGEVLLPGNKYIELGKKNRRNCVAGLMNQKGTENCKFLNVKFYEVINSENDSELLRFRKLSSEFDEYNLPKKEIFAPNTLSIEILTSQLNEWKKDCGGIYDIDGIVISKEISKRENDYRPKNKIAFKIDENGKTTKVLDCKWQVSRTGRIKPVLEIEPVDICGVTIQNVTAHNYKYIVDNKIGIGTKIDIVRSGDVIPFITHVYNSSNEIFKIKNCPSCGMQLESFKLEDLELSNVDLICNNPNCFAKVAGKISYFFSTLEVEYMSNKTVENLMDNLNLFNIEDFYNLTSNDMIGLKGFGEKKIQKIISEIKKSLNCKPENLLSAFGISGIGKENAKNLFEKYTFEELFNIQSIENIDGFGEITSNKFIKGMNKYKNLYNFLQKKGLTFIFEEEKMLTLKNKIFTLTGAGNKSRKDYNYEIENMGGVVKGITGKTKFLVANDVNSKSGKMKKALALEIEIISYNDLDRMLT